MLSSQVSLEAMYSTTYVENYLDCVENLPDDLQRHLSRLRELDCTYRAYLREVEQQTDHLDLDDTMTISRRTRRIKKALIAAQELGDEKLHVVQQLQDLIENRTRRLDLDFKNLDYGKEEPPVEPKETVTPVSNAATVSTTTTTGSTERQSKRARRTRQEALQPAENASVANEPAAAPEHVLRSSAVVPIASAATQKKTNAGTGKKKKRKTRAGTTQAVQREESPPREDEPAIDPDEPTYCLCDQISFGEMILCDNDLCPIEWFHFSCVALTTKPKGKWYCPKCRGDRPNIMKPKALFLKELERYNKEKEEKT